MTVADLHERMSSEEYIQWSVYYARKAQKEQLEHRRRA